MRRYRSFLLVLAVALPLLGCTKGNECDRCETDEDCKQGFVCNSFSDDSRRCGSGIGATTCRVR